MTGERASTRAPASARRPEARASFARAGRRTEPQAPVRDGRPALALSPLDRPVRGGARQHRRRRGGRGLLPRRGRRWRRARPSRRRPRRRKRSTAARDRRPGSRPASRSDRGRACAGCRRRRSCSTARGSSGRSPSTWPPTPSFSPSRRWCSAGLRRGRRASTRPLRDSWRLWRAGRLVFADSTRLDHAGATLDRPACGAGARAVATILASAPDIEARLPDLRAALDGQGRGGRSGRERVRRARRRASRLGLAKPIARARDRRHSGAHRTQAAAPLAIGVESASRTARPFFRTDLRRWARATFSHAWSRRKGRRRVLQPWHDDGEFDEF